MFYKSKFVTSACETRFRLHVISLIVAQSNRCRWSGQEISGHWVQQLIVYSHVGYHSGQQPTLHVEFLNMSLQKVFAFFVRSTRRSLNMAKQKRNNFGAARGNFETQKRSLSVVLSFFFLFFNIIHTAKLVPRTSFLLTSHKSQKCYVLSVTLRREDTIIIYGACYLLHHISAIASYAGYTIFLCVVLLFRGSVIPKPQQSKKTSKGLALSKLDAVPEVQ